MRAKGKDSLILLIVLLIGLVIGGLIGDILGQSFEILTYGKSIGFSPVTVDLSVIQFTIGLKMSINLASILGLISAILIFRKL
ncbi:MAG: DUF4321 domain-containing protein [Clostridia bacterium]|nr:DUF4321 domain-containing protein [Clostridia bacterium]